MEGITDGFEDGFVKAKALSLIFDKKFHTLMYKYNKNVASFHFEIFMVLKMFNDSHLLVKYYPLLIANLALISPCSLNWVLKRALILFTKCRWCYFQIYFHSININGISVHCNCRKYENVYWGDKKVLNLKIGYNL